LTKTKAAAALVLRYLTARALFRRTDWEVPANLEDKIAGGVRAFPGGALLNEVALMPAPAIIYDRKDPDFWTAIIGGDDNAIDIDPKELSELRDFVMNGECALPFPRQSRFDWVSRLTDWLPGIWGTQPIAKLRAGFVLSSAQPAAQVVHAIHEHERALDPAHKMQSGRKAATTD
jgi:hypothetical protein